MHYGLDRYEKIYNLSNDTNDLTARRYNILAKINNRVPYTMNWLKNKLNNTIGKENYKINIDFKYTNINYCNNNYNTINIYCT